MLKLLGIIIVGVGLLAWGISSYLSIDDIKNCAKPDVLDSACAPADAIVAISGGDTTARASEAIKLYKQGWAPKIIFSGAALDTSGPSNAEAMRTQAMKAGVPARDIMLDTISADTVQNATNTIQLLGARDKRIILVTSPYHQRRASILFQRALGEQITIVNHPTPNDRYWSDQWWTSPNGWLLGISELLKSWVVVTWR